MGNPGTTKSGSTERRDEKTSRDRLSEATSEKTVSDLEKSEKISSSTSDNQSSETSVPSPDGIERGDGRADGSDSGDPM